LVSDSIGASIATFGSVVNPDADKMNLLTELAVMKERQATMFEQ
jgi:hypothetical protein